MCKVGGLFVDFHGEKVLDSSSNVIFKSCPVMRCLCVCDQTIPHQITVR